MTFIILMAGLKLVSPEQVNRERPDYIVEAIYPTGNVHAIELRPIGKGSNIVVYSSLPYTVKVNDTCRAEIVLQKVSE